ncbi:hypothetical protein BU23DRAFT_663951, partial [Bimuria novae-zelandiae CBS 107.79]
TTSSITTPSITTPSFSLTTFPLPLIHLSYPTTSLTHPSIHNNLFSSPLLPPRRIKPPLRRPPPPHLPRLHLLHEEIILRPARALAPSCALGVGFLVHAPAFLSLHSVSILSVCNPSSRKRLSVGSLLVLGSIHRPSCNRIPAHDLARLSEVIALLPRRRRTQKPSLRLRSSLEGARCGCRRWAQGRGSCVVGCGVGISTRRRSRGVKDLV